MEEEVKEFNNAVFPFLTFVLPFAVDTQRNIVSVFLVLCAGSPKSGSTMNDYIQAVDKLLGESR